MGIARVTGDAANAVPELGAGPVLYLTALISMNLAFVNLCRSRLSTEADSCSWQLAWFAAVEMSPGVKGLST